jgi:hypothetical protein
VIASLPENVRTAIVASFTHSFRYVYLVGAGICIVGVVLAVFLKELPLRRWGPPTPSADAAAQAGRPASPAKPDDKP